MHAVCSGCGIGAAEGAPLTNNLDGLVRVGMWHERCWKRQNGQSEQCGGDLESTNSTSVGDSPTDGVSGPQIFGNEAADVLVRFLVELQRATGDGARKRRAGEKPPWYLDRSHEGAIFSHLTKWKRGELVDPDSGAHPLVHAAWRCLAIACQESGNVPERHAE